jgi:hypothetical protein
LHAPEKVIVVPEIDIVSPCVLFGAVKSPMVRASEISVAWAIWTVSRPVRGTIAPPGVQLQWAVLFQATPVAVVTQLSAQAAKAVKASRKSVRMVAP